MKIESELKTNFSSALTKTVVNITYTAKCIDNQLAKILSEFDVKVQHFNIMRILRGKDPEPTNPSYIRSVMVDKNRDLTRLLDKLAKKGWIDREIGKINRRKVELRLTPLGKEMTDLMSEKVDDFFAEIKGFDPDNLNAISDLLDDLRVQVQNYK